MSVRDHVKDDFRELLRRWHQANPPRLAWRDGCDAEQWQREFRDALQALRGPVPERVDPEVELIESTDMGDHTRQLLVINVTELTRLPAYLLVPGDRTADTPGPGLVVTHGHGFFGIDSMTGATALTTTDARSRAYALDAVRAGYVVMCPAWWGWAGRDGHTGAVGRRDKCNVIQMAASMHGFNVLDLRIQDGQAALDVLLARPDVDPEKIGCLGNSYGGRTAMWLSVFDPRIRCTVASGCANQFVERSNHLKSCAIQCPPGLLQLGDVAEVMALVAPRPLQIMAGTNDHLLNRADREHIHTVCRQVYRGLGAEDNLELALHEGGHRLVWSLAEPFLARHLA